MKYELIKTDISAERTVMQDIVEIIEDVETVTGTEPTDNYEVTITMGIHPIDGIGADFSKDITVTSSNAQTGFQVDEQREQAVSDFIASINE
jgi:uncharacterized membrane-anchored protein